MRMLTKELTQGFTQHPEGVATGPMCMSSRLEDQGLTQHPGGVAGDHGA